jgi:aspartyl-tRNA(Asn)/glutamyl-tRNA(Gln) amidotransferase subunit C
MDVDYVAKLARIHLNDDKKKGLNEDLKRILQYIEQLNELDVSQVAPTSHVLNLENVFRKDKVNPSKVRDDLLKYAPASEGKYFKVPKVIEED